VVALGDSIIGLHASSDVVQRMAAAFERTGAGAIVAFEEVPRAEVGHYGIARPGPAADGLFRVEDLVEKPRPADAPSTLAIAARYVLSPEIFDALEHTPAGKGGEIQLTDGIRLLIERGRPVFGLCLTAAERRFDIGNIDAYFRAFVEFALADAKHGPLLRAFVRGLLDADHP
jgi:UTP--glucose-1-phosphate uridylyltransferase